MAAALGVETAALAAHGPDAPRQDAINRFHSFIDRRLSHEPVSRIIGGREFYGRWYEVSGATLDPRPETETLVDLCLSLPFLTALDLGTGTGCIAVSLASERPDARVTATDRDPDALAVSARNAAAHGVADRVSLRRSDWFDDLDGSFDLIVSNPPYIPASELAGLVPEVRDWDPLGALTDGQDGLGAFRAIAKGARRFLKAEGHCCVEFGHGQLDAVAEIFRERGLRPVTVARDLSGKNRAIVFASGG